MKARSLKMIVSLSLLLLGSQAALAQKNSKSLNTLGSEELLLEKAKPSIPANTYRVIQKRVIDRENRFEFAGLLGGVSGGDSYYNTRSAGVQGEFHFSHRWSLGARYQWNANGLTPEGKRMYEGALTAPGNGAPEITWPTSSAIATISFYPLYGKMSWFESTVSYFDFYMLVGGGVTQTSNPWLGQSQSPIYTAGLGMGMWWTQYLTSRIEIRFQSYNDQLTTGSRRIENANLSFAFGFLL